MYDCPVQHAHMNYRFTGKERDAESGLDYFGARYYASNMGRFMSPDWSAKEDPVPYANLGNPQTLNLYAYVHNNPLSTYDPDGHNAFTDFFKNTWQRIENGFTGYGFHTDAQVQNTVDRTRAALRNGGASPGTIEKLSYKQTYKLGTAKLHQGVNAIDVGEGVVVTLTFGEKVRNTLNHIGETGEAPEGYEGGREFQNREGKLPSTDANGNPIKYQEYDVNPRQPGVNRGGERVVTGSDGSQYSTSDHYDTFTKIK
jgi:RHS repeat-associated protein